MEMVDEVRRLFDYNRWANQRVLDTVAELSTEELAGPVGEGILDLLRHIVSVQEEWRGAVSGEAAVEPDLDRLDQVVDAFDASHRLMLRLLERDPLPGWEAQAIEGFVPTVGTIVIQVMMHGVQHRAEVGLMLNTLGRSTGDLDFLAFALE